MKSTFTVFLLLFFVNSFAQKYELVNADRIYINGNLKIFSSKTEFLKHFGKADKITEDFPACGSYDEEVQKGTKFYIHEKAGIKYMVYGNQVELQEINLKDFSEHFVMIGKHKISNKTTIQDLAKIFPTSSKNFENEKDAGMFRFKFNQKWDDEVQISIENGKVSTIYYWSPC